MSIRRSLINLGNKVRSFRNTKWFQSKGFTPILRNLIQAMYFASYVKINGVGKLIENNRTENERAFITFRLFIQALMYVG